MMMRRAIHSCRRLATASKVPCVLLNAARLDYDGRLDFSRLEAVADVTRFEVSAEADVAARCAGAAVVVNKELPLSAAVIGALPDSVGLVVEAGTGYNNIDLAAARERGISVCNVPTYATEAMAQMAITSVLALSCSLWQQASLLARGDRSVMRDCHLGALPHFEIAGKTLGLVGGRGTIGRRVAAMARALGMVVVASDLPSTPLGDDGGLEVVAFGDLLARSDFVSVHCPLSPATTGLVDAAALGAMKETAFLINTARGDIVDRSALVAALAEKSIAGAALDVYGPGSAPPPALPEDDPLYGLLDNVILTPHIGWQRLEARQRVVDMCADSVSAFLAGEPANVDTATGLPRARPAARSEEGCST
jgi:glycerate dehydrogenase